MSPQGNLSVKANKNKMNLQLNNIKIGSPTSRSYPKSSKSTTNSAAKNGESRM